MTEMAVDPGSGTPVRAHNNVWAGGKLLATYDANGQQTGQPTTGQLHFYLDDPLGSRRVQTNDTGAVEQNCQSLPYGDGESCAPVPTEHLFTGKERDAESGNDYFGARYYNSNMGRFMSPDWSAKVEPVPYAKLNDPQSLNLYSYVLNNPLGAIDPDGHASCADSPGVCMAIGYSIARGMDAGEAMANGAAQALAFFMGQMMGGAQQQSAQSSTTTVTVNSRPADIPGGQLLHDAGVNHEWITTPDGTSVGMGTAQGVPQSDAPGVQTQVVDHRGQVPTSTQTFTGVDKAALATYTKVGTPTGRWIPGVNDCNTWVTNVVGQSTPHNVLSGFDPTGAPPHIIYRNVVVYADGSVHSPGGP